jgi:hypothetical protein
MRVLVARRGGRRWGWGAVVSAVLLPALTSGFAHLALVRSLRGHWNYALVDAAVCTVTLAVGLVLVRSRSSRARSLARWAPAAATALLVVYSAVRFASFGAEMPHASAATAHYERPPIVLIVLDTVRADHLKLYGYSRDTMPALERWGSQATVFMRAVSTGGWTAPSHASMFSGLTVSQHGVHYDGSPEMSFTSAREGIDWLPELLVKEGYRTIAVTANPFSIEFGVGGFEKVFMSRRDGWYDGTIGGVVDHFSPLLNEVNYALCWRLPYLDARRIADITMRAAAPRDERPPFLFVNMLDAHAPYNPPPAATDRLRVDPGDAFRRFRAQRELTRMVHGKRRDDMADLPALYDAELRWIDMNLSRLLEWIDGQYGDDAVVIVTSDHGEGLGEEGVVGHEYGLSQRIVHVPLIVRAPGMTAGTVDHVVNLRSLFDFMLATGRGEAPGADTIIGDGEFDYVCERYQHPVARSLDPDDGLPCVAIFDGGYKAIGPSEGNVEVLDVTAFDHPVEAVNAPAADSLLARIDAYWDAFQDDRQSRGTKPSDELQKKLRSLGYIK